MNSKTSSVLGSSIFAIATALAVAPSAKAASIKRNVTFYGEFEKNGEECTLRASGNGETWLKGTGFNWIWSSRAEENVYRAEGTGDRVVDQTDIGTMVTAYTDPDGNVTRYTVERAGEEGSFKNCIINP